MWSDNETNTDYLNHSEVAELVCEMISDKSLLPLSIGIYGGWGVGKSSILNFVRDTQEKSEKSIVIEFDAWLYQGFDEAKTALMTVIAQRLIEATPESLKDKAFDLYKRANKLKFLGLATEIGMAAAGLPVFGAASKALSASKDISAGEGDEADVAALKESVDEAKTRTQGLFEPKEIRSAPEEITAFKAEFSDLLKKIDKTLVVFVDNLDRCLPKTAIQNLEAMRLFLSLPDTVFVVAADVDMVRHAVSQEFSGPSKKHVDDYLDKLIHFPVTVPRLGLQEVQSYITLLKLSRTAEISEETVEDVRTLLIDKIRNSWADNSGITIDTISSAANLPSSVQSGLESALRLAPLLTRSKAVAGNPRIIKRMLNVVSMRHSLAERRKMALDESIIAKLSLFERCTNEQAFGDLLEIINGAPKGKAKSLSLKKLEAIAKKPEDYPVSWKDHVPFIEEWGALAPELSSIDLRPAVYLARETLPIQIRSASLSPDAMKAATGLLKVSSRTSPTAETLVSSIPPEERATVMRELVATLKQNSDWSSKRNDLNGALVLALRFDETKSDLLLFLRSQPSPRPWLKTIIEELEKGAN